MKKFLILPILCVSLFFSCGNGGENKQEASKDSTKTEANVPSKTSEPSKTSAASADALTRMQGKWQSLDDAKNIIEIKGNKITTVYDNDTKGAIVENIDFSQECQKTCSMNGDIDLKGTTCFMTKGQFDANCFTLISVDDKNLEYSMIGGDNKPLKFKKI